MRILDNITFFFIKIFAFLATFFIGMAMWEGTYIIGRILVVLAILFGVYKVFDYFFDVNITAGSHVR